jgi:ABC-2 type transport system permease protein
MTDFFEMIRVEWLKAMRSRIPLWTTLGSLFLPVVVALMILISKNPEISKKLGVVSAKANLVGFAATQWSTYMGLVAEILATAGFFMFIVIVSWIFGREFADGTAKDLLAVPVPRETIILGKLAVFAIWSAAMSLLILVGSLIMGAVIGLPGGSTEVIMRGTGITLGTAGLVVLVVVPFAYLASNGRGYLLPLSLAVFTLILANVAIALGWGDLFPWSIPGLYSQDKNLVGAAGIWVVVVTGMVGWFITNRWWKTADQHR